MLDLKLVSSRGMCGNYHQVETVHKEYMALNASTEFGIASVLADDSKSLIIFVSRVNINFVLNLKGKLTAARFTKNFKVIL